MNIWVGREDSISYRTMIVNQGSYRNLPHLHLKIWVTEEEQLKTQQQWSDEKKEWWKQLQTLATRSKKKRKVECVFFQRNRRCRNGANCDFQHSINQGSIKCGASTTPLPVERLSSIDQFGHLNCSYILLSPNRKSLWPFDHIYISLFSFFFKLYAVFN